MGATFNRVKTWIAETFNASDINAEFDNILNNLTPAGMDDYSANTTAMRTQTDPGEAGSESLATSLAGEIERLRYAIAELKGTTYWYTTPSSTLSSLNTVLGSGSLPPSRIISGKSSANSSQSILLVPEGAGVGNNLVIQGTPTNLVYYVDGTQYTLAANVTISSTTAPPTTNNTALVDDASISDQAWTKWTGMYDDAIPIGTIGSEITSRNGRLTAFRLDNGSTSEYFLGIPDTTNNQIKNCRRGYFFDENAAAVPAIAFATGDTITLMNIVYVFLTSAGAASVTYNTPVISPTTPSTPTIGDYWYDTVTETWKVYDGITYNASNAAYIGIGLVDENGDCVAARSEDVSTTYLETSTVELSYSSATQVISNKSPRLAVFGSIIPTYTNHITWNITTDLDTGSESTSTMYFFYVTETGATKVSATAPIDMVSSRGGYYHPSETWRCFGQAWNNASGDLTNVISYHTDNVGVAIATSSVSGNALILEFWSSPVAKFRVYDGTDTAGTYVLKSFPIYQSLTVPSGATLSHVSGISDTVVLHMVCMGDYTTLGVSAHQYELDQYNTVALGTASDAASLYTTKAYTAAKTKGIAWGYSDQATAGTWAANLDNFSASAYMNVCRSVQVGVDSSSTTSATYDSKASISAFLNAKRHNLFTLECDTGDATANNGIRLLNSGGGSVNGRVAFYVNSSRIKAFTYNINIGGATTAQLNIHDQPTHLFRASDVASGIQTCEVYTNGDGTANISLIGYTFVIREMPYEGL